MDFNSLASQIALNEQRLEQEKLRTETLSSRINYISLIYAIVAFFITGLLEFIAQIEFDKVECWAFIILFVTFIIILTISVFWTIKLMVPIEFAFIEEPKVFYNDVKNQYINEGVEEPLINEYICLSYLNQLETALTINIDNNIKKSRFNFLAIKYSMLSVIPYIFCIVIMVAFKNDVNYKVEVTNLNKINMSKSENKPKVDPVKIIARPPKMVKQSADTPTVKAPPVLKKK